MTQLVKYNELRQSIEKAKTIVEVKDNRDKAEAIRGLVKDSGMSLEMQNLYAELRVRSERKGGAMLIDMAKNGERETRGGDRKSKSHDATLILKDIGINRDKSSRWQMLALIPDDVFESTIKKYEGGDNEITSAAFLEIAKEYKKASKKDEKAADTGTSYQLICSNIEDIELPDESVDFIITDPPYPFQYIDVYLSLSALASRVLRPGGSLLAMAGQSYLPDVIDRLDVHMTYHWTLSYLTPGGQAAQMWQRKVNTFWKPVLWYVKGDYAGRWIGDVAKSEANDNDKRFHHWGQSVSGMVDLIDRITFPGAVVLDPFCGGGSTGIAALSLGRSFIGSDVDGDCVELCQRRIEEFVCSSIKTTA